MILSADYKIFNNHNAVSHTNISRHDIKINKARNICASMRILFVSLVDARISRNGIANKFIELPSKNFENDDKHFPIF